MKDKIQGSDWYKKLESEKKIAIASCLACSISRKLRACDMCSFKDGLKYKEKE